MKSADNTLARALSSTAAEAIPAKLSLGSMARFARGLRTCEKIILFYFAYVTIEAMVFPLALAGRVFLAVLNVGTGFVLTAIARLGNAKSPATTTPPGANSGSARAAPSHVGPRAPREEQFMAANLEGPSPLMATLRDWFPALLILVAYRESGLFSIAPGAHYLDYMFVRWDRLLLQNRWVLEALRAGAPWLQRYLEFSYLLCYPLVPLGMTALYIRFRRPGLQPERNVKLGRAADQFWTAVLLALLTCYALFPFFPSTPPRLLLNDRPGPAVQPLLRGLNFWILAHYGITTSVFPSGHVAAVTATGLSIRLHWPRVGIAFLIAAASVAAATVLGRYHYAADAVTGGLMGVGAFLVSKQIYLQKPTS